MSSPDLTACRLRHSCLYALAGLVFIVAALALLPFTRAIFLRNLAWLSLQRAVLGPSNVPVEPFLEAAGHGFARAAAFAPGDSLARDGLGLVYLQYGAVDSAAELFAQVPDASPWADAARLHLLLAQTEQMGAAQGAVIGGVVRSWCNEAGLTAQLNAFAGAGRCDLAGQWLAWVAARCDLPAAAQARGELILGQCYLKADVWLAGLGHLEEAARLAPTDVSVWLALGDAWLAGGERTRALQAYERARILDPASESVRSRLNKLGAP